MTGYTTAEVAEILGIAPPRVRALARAGLLAPGRGPRRHYRFTFQDIVVLRVIRELHAAGLSPRRIHRALQRLRLTLPPGRPLTALHISAEGERVVVRDRGTAWEPESGQTLFDFPVAELAGRAAPFAPRVLKAPGTEGMDAEGWFDLGVDLEAVSVREAMAAYRKALSLDPGHARAHLNLGRLLHEEGDPAAALDHYLRSEEAAPGHATARYNQGVALEDLGRGDEALVAYLGAVEMDPELAAAHFNLARLYEASGDASGALRHLAAYRRLREGSR